MIKLKIYRNKNKNICKFKLEGHSGYSKAGSDIICSAVSLLVFNTINSIEAFTNEKFDYSLKEAGAYLSCEFPNIEQNIDNHDVKLLLDTMLLGIQSLEEQEEYKKYVRIYDKEV